ncbi:acyltransferase family protein [Methanobrevibacter sp.]|uniref:acyltransferase family protein n=1 Tax=Methanobrevibacter sp. TaxID=66852 RepID=UPI0025FF368E|nr:acyltransferase family protein [Methanobrevibacter sp.]MBR4448483.1 acyltransferase family protein [Methanobrevibacter sp.]
MNAVKSGRINKFDNLKGLAIFLMVLGHLTLFRGNDFIGFVRNFVFLFHLPVFFFVAGYFSKVGPDEPIKAFKRLFIPYIVFCVIWEIFNVYCLGEHPNSILFIHPGYMLWFLMSLFFMKMAVPIIDRLKYPIILAVIGSLLIGFIDSNILGISRTFCYLPIFILGFKYKDYRERFIDKFPIVEDDSFAITIAVITLIISVVLALNFNHDIISMKHMYGDEYLMEMICRAMVIFVSAVNVVVLTRFMTNREIILTQMGLNSLTVYLLHPYAIKIAKALAEPYLKNHIKITIAFIFIGAFAITYLLSRNIFTKALNKLLDLVYKVLCIE